VSGALLQTLDEPVDAAITTSAGYPLDLTYYQCIKGVTAASHIVKPGGSILLLAACTEGVGAPEFAAMLRAGLSDTEFLEKIKGAAVTVDQWQLEKLAMVTSRQHLDWYVPGLPPEYHLGLWGKSHASAESAIAALVSTLQRGAKIAVIPEGPYVLAKARECEMAGWR
jgi:nickel-dependent lactate racemase